MCISPNRLANGQLVRCRNCWQCRAQAIDDWAGRCIAEGKTAKASHFITLTYGRDKYGEQMHERAVVLTYSDVQKYLRHLRKIGYPCRYFCVGEYGHLKGRAHWHLIVYWLDKVPPHKMNVRYDDPHWPHGLSYWEAVTYNSARYCVKYMKKDAAAGKQAHFAMSKKPPIGAEYFRRVAMRYVEQGLAPRDLFYSFPDVLGKDGKPRKFMLSGASAELFLKTYVELWKENRGGHMPSSQLIEEYVDDGSWSRSVSDMSLTLQMDEKPATKSYRPDYLPSTTCSPAKFSNALKAYYVDFEGRRLYWSYDDEGHRTWQEKVRVPADGAWKKVKEACATRVKLTYPKCVSVR